MSKFPIAKEGFTYILSLLILAVLFYPFSITIAAISFALSCFVMFFFRNPNRKIVKHSNNILSPADGVIMDVKDVYEDSFINGNAKKVSIFLSIFNVHVNKSPIDGIVKYKSYRPGKYLPAFKSHASEINEKNTIGIEGDSIKILVSQITGFIARRIVCWVKENDNVIQGENFGLIKFGSCTEIIVPQNVNILVKPGQKVRGGLTVMGVIENEG